MSFLNVAKNAALAAGKYQLEKLGAERTIKHKGEIDIVTEVDKACEEMIVNTLLQAHPDHAILAEEGSGSGTQADYKWIIDPLDGTTNYAHRYPLFCVSIALEHKGEIILGVIYNPNLDELFWAEKGKGAFLNGKPIHVSEIDDLKQSLLVTGFAYNIHETGSNLEHFKNIIMQAQAVRRDGVAAIDLCYVACGRYEGFWESNLYAWDVAAGKLILEEAGGRVTRFDDSPVTVYDREILATNGGVHARLVGILGEGK